MNAFALARIWTPILTQKLGSLVELRGHYDFVQYLIMKAYDLFREPRPQVEQVPVYELE